MGNEKDKMVWDVDDIDRTSMFPKDCRYYNGGFVQPDSERKYWEYKQPKTALTKSEKLRLLAEAGLDKKGIPITKTGIIKI